MIWHMASGPSAIWNMSNLVRLAKFSRVSPQLTNSECPNGHSVSVKKWSSEIKKAIGSLSGSEQKTSVCFPLFQVACAKSVMLNSSRSSRQGSLLNGTEVRQDSVNFAREISLNSIVAEASLIFLASSNGSHHGNPSSSNTAVPSDTLSSRTEVGCMISVVSNKAKRDCGVMLSGSQSP